MHSCAHAMLVMAALALSSPRFARAQDSTASRQDSTAHSRYAGTPQRDGWIVGPLIGLPGVGSESYPELVTLGVGATRLVPNHMGLDFAVGTLPRAIPYGVVPLAVRIGPSIPLAMGPDAFFIPSGGFSAAGVVGTEGVGGFYGWYLGAATVVATGSVGFRAGVTVLGPPGLVRPIWLAEIGIMHVPLPPSVH